jgi:hypothetical protein
VPRPRRPPRPAMPAIVGQIEPQIEPTTNG